MQKSIEKYKQEVKGWKFLVKEGMRTQNALFRHRKELLCHLDAYGDFISDIGKAADRLKRKREKIVERFMPKSLKGQHH